MGDRRLGTTDLEVTPLCIGCAELGSMPESFAYTVPEGQALETLLERKRVMRGRRGQITAID